MGGYNSRLLPMEAMRGGQELHWLPAEEPCRPVLVAARDVSEGTEL